MGINSFSLEKGEVVQEHRKEHMVGINLLRSPARLRLPLIRMLEPKGEGGGGVIGQLIGSDLSRIAALVW